MTYTYINNVNNLRGTAVIIANFNSDIENALHQELLAKLATSN